MTDKSGSATQVETAAPPANPAAVAAGEHFARFYTNDATLVDSVAAYVIEGVRDGAAAIVIAIREHATALEARWAELHFDAAAATSRGQLLMLDAVQALSKFMMEGTPDRDRFMKSVGQVVARAAERHHRVAAFGEMVSVLWAEGKSGAAVELESLWNELAQRYPLTLFCGYALRDCTAEDGDTAFEQVYVLAKRIREAPWGRRALLIAVTGWGQSEDKRRAQEAGFDHHLAKPVSAEALEAALQMIKDMRPGPRMEKAWV